jgi:hypothetical protein
MIRAAKMIVDQVQMGADQLPALMTQFGPVLLRIRKDAKEILRLSVQYRWVCDR